MQDKFDELCQVVRQDQYLKASMALLEWDQQTKLPEQGGAYRAEQITFLAGEIHKRQTDPGRGELLTALSESDLASNKNSDSGSTIRVLMREYEKKTKLPDELVQASARAAAVGQQVWIAARKDNDFAKFAPSLDEIFRLKREQADAIGFTDERYDALLDDYEPGASTAEVAGVLEALRNDLVPLLEKIAGAKHQVDTSCLRREFPETQQRKFCTLASERIGFEFGRGRLDTTHHPFCTELGPDDVRITTRFDPNFFNMAFFGTMHEAGHGIYEQGLRADQYGLPPGKYCSLGIHESQSRLWENLVGRSRAFWDYFYSPAQQHFDSLADVDVEEFYAAINAVGPSLIRVEADEATYNLHIIIRFELEREILNGEFATSELPEAWNSKYQQYLGIMPDSDSNGVMQDIHWSAGLFGYFPTYSLGNLYASQFFDAAEAELGNLQQMFAKGDFAPLKEWLNTKIHQQGSRFPSDELGLQVSGKKIDHQPLIKHLTSKLAPIYRI